MRVADATEVAPFLSHFHYLRSVRQDSIFVGAFYKGQLAAVCSVSPLDLPSVIEQLPIANSAQGAVISRVFAFDWAPRTSSPTCWHAPSAPILPVREDVRILLTYLNPNMGFTGASYRAANWMIVGHETGTRYAYLNERYITDRQANALTPEVRPEVRYSRMPLLPLALLCRTLDKSLRAARTRRVSVRHSPSRSGCIAGLQPAGKPRANLDRFRVDDPESSDAIAGIARTIPPMLEVVEPPVARRELLGRACEPVPVGEAVPIPDPDHAIRRAALEHVRGARSPLRRPRAARGVARGFTFAGERWSLGSLQNGIYARGDSAGRRR